MRLIAWLLLAAYLLVVGLWPPAATPVQLVLDGAGLILAAIPGAVWLAAALIHARRTA